jgi:hypothetical protein
MAAGDIDYGWIDGETFDRIWADFDDSWIHAFEALREDVLNGMGFWKPASRRADEVVAQISWASCLGWEDVAGGYEYRSAKHPNGRGILRRLVPRA